METISFYSYKGGTGRTLAVANIARHLARLGLKVVALDFDLEAPALHYKFNLDRQDDPIPIERGIVNYLREVAAGQPAPKLMEYAVSVPVSRTSGEVIHFIAAGTAPSPEYWRDLFAVNWHEFLYGPGGRGVRVLLQLKEHIAEELKPDFLLIDSRTGVTDIGGAATAVLPDKLVCFLLANRENMEGARVALRGLLRGPRPPHARPPEIVPVLSRIPTSDEAETEEQVVKQILDFLNEPDEDLENTLHFEDLPVLHSEPELLIQECLLIGGKKSPDESVLLRDYLRLFAKIVPHDTLQSRIPPPD